MSYARGYRDGYAGSPKDVPDCGISQKDIDNCLAPEPMRPFAVLDYLNGYDAGANDAKWTRHYAGAGLRDNNGRSVEAE